MSWIAVATIGAGALGAGVSAYGAKKQSKAVESANEANDARQAEQNQSAWNAYLISRGINPAGAKTGELPQNAQAVNSKLPLWATANFKTPGSQMTWRKKGSSPTPNSLVMGPPAGAPVAMPPVGGPYNPWEQS